MGINSSSSPFSAVDISNIKKESLSWRERVRKNVWSAVDDAAEAQLLKLIGERFKVDFGAMSALEKRYYKRKLIAGLILNFFACIVLLYFGAINIMDDFMLPLLPLFVLLLVLILNSLQNVWLLDIVNKGVWMPFPFMFKIKKLLRLFFKKPVDV